MKQFFGRMIIVAIVFVFFGLIGRFETTYKVNAKVIEINKGDNYISFEDETGNVFSIYYETGYTEGNKVKLILDNNFTEENREDDIIIKVKKY